MPVYLAMNNTYRSETVRKEAARVFGLLSAAEKAQIAEEASRLLTGSALNALAEHDAPFELADRLAVRLNYLCFHS